MKYISAAAGFVLATLITLGARAQPPAHPDYVEFTVHDIAKSKAFYGAVFGWTFTDYGPGYASFDDGRIGGGLTTDGTPHPGGPLIVFYAGDLDATLARVKAAGGVIVKPPFTFPGGRRFHFTDPDGIEVARRIRSRHETLSRFFSLFGLDTEIQRRDIEGIEHHLSPATLEFLADLAAFFEENPERLKQFKQFRTRAASHC